MILETINNTMTFKQQSQGWTPLWGIILPTTVLNKYIIEKTFREILKDKLQLKIKKL